MKDKCQGCIVRDPEEGKDLCSLCESRRWLAKTLDVDKAMDRALANART